LKDYYSGIVASRRRKDLPFRKYFWERRRLFMEGMEKAGKNGRVLVVCPPAQSKTGALTGNVYKLRETHLFGKKEAENKIIPFLAEGSLKRDSAEV
ncbi:hypothetical protein HYU15_03875, partial [Candidatus Woesearchaeota archaeon]|nr:hypothetical protein [Candidatus Woesearchaeota archaeon]